MTNALSEQVSQTTSFQIAIV